MPTLDRIGVASAEDSDLKQQLQDDTAVRDHVRSEGAKQAIHRIIIFAIYLFPASLVLGYGGYILFLLYTRQMDIFASILSGGSYILIGGISAELARLGIKMNDEK